MPVRAGVIAASFLVATSLLAAPVSADGPPNTYSAFAGGNHDWGPSSGSGGGTSGTAVTFAGAMSDSHGVALYTMQSGPGVVRARQVGTFTNPAGLTLRFDPGLNLISETQLTISGPGSQVMASLNLHVDGTFIHDCPGSMSCANYVDIQAQLDSAGGRTIVNWPNGGTANTLGLTIESVPGGYRIHGDVSTPPALVPVGVPIGARLMLTVVAGHLGSGYRETASWDGDFDNSVTFAPTGPVVNLPAGYTVAGEHVVDNVWVDPFTPFGSITGSIIDDVDEDGARDPSEPGLPGITVYLDASGNGAFDPGEPSAETGPDGRYHFIGLIPGTHVIDHDASDLPLGFAPTGTRPRTVDLAPGEDAAGLDFLAQHPTPALVADYRFNDTRASSVGSPPDLIDVGPGTNAFTDATVDGTPRRVLTFPAGNGVALSPTAGVIPSDRYTIVMLVNLDPFDVWAKLLDFRNGQEFFTGLDLYPDGYLGLGGAVSCFGDGTTLALPGTWAELGLTRDGAGTIHLYVDGVEQYHCSDPAGDVIIGSDNVLRFFSGHESDFHASGSVARIRLFADALTPAEIAVLDAAPPPPPPPSGDLVIADCTDPALADVTSVTGDLIVADPDCAQLSLPNLTSVAGDVVIVDTTTTTIGLGSLETVVGSIDITGNGAAGAIDLGSLETVVGSIDITGNGAAGAIDLGSLGAAGSVDVSDNSAGTVVSVGGLDAVAGDVTIETAGNLDVGGAVVRGDADLTAHGADSVAGTTAGGATEVSILGGTAAMHVGLPDGTFDAPVAFTIERLGDAAPEDGTDAAGDPATVDPIAAYAFTFAIPTLGMDATLSFDVDLGALDAPTRDALLGALADGAATLATKGDAAGSAFRAFVLCPAGEAPAADGCVVAETLDAAGQPTNGTPNLVRFSGVVGHFSTWAVAIVTSTVDTTPPTIAPHDDVTVEASGPDGAVVTYADPAADDDMDAAVDIACLPASGGQFALGATAVICTATDDAANRASSTFDVIVTDTSGPVIAAHADVTVSAGEPGGASDAYTPPTASDLVDGPVAVVCTPAPNVLFPVGTTPVTCTARDAAGNDATPVTFMVTVVSALDQLAALRAEVDASRAEKGLRNDLSNKLKEAIRELERAEPHLDHACKKVGEFADKLASEAGKKKPRVDALTAETWLAAAARIRSALGC